MIVEQILSGILTARPLYQSPPSATATGVRPYAGNPQRKYGPSPKVANYIRLRIYVAQCETSTPAGDVVYVG